MAVFKLLIVEDEAAQVEIYKDNIEDYGKENDIDFDITVAKTKDEALANVKGVYDGAIVDIKLDSGGDEGNEVIKEINTNARFPVAVVTGTPANVTDTSRVVKVFTRTDNFKDIISELVAIYKTGLTNILGGRGEIEKAMDKVFWKNIYPQREVWKSHLASGKETEKALLRFTINHLMEFLDDSSEFSFPEEMYIIPPISDNLKTGTIVQHKEHEVFYVILTPACDLVMRDGECKTDRIKLCEIEKFKSLKDSALKEITNANKQKKRLARLLRNNDEEFYHWLPLVNGFSGGFINFRKTLALSTDEIDDKFHRSQHTNISTIH